ncbi:flagellar hook-associated protein FlgL [Virgibacillus sp. LDC-1]|uniref:flagellar hook-associated protein FlgL n=1 Tax=Virgibacillus sp. LDC-1 TaxID=3039856 RepID=UPI0024DE5A53|nr:flagellar hook-associated protein FlgL [Virgibacillus sp. LDC-1]
MRITQNMLSNNMLRNLSNNYSKLDMIMEQLHTGKKITRPSDDPVVAMQGMNYRTQVIEIEQFARNTSEVNNWMDNSDAALDKATKALQKIRELAVQASNDTYDEAQRQNIKEEVEQLKKHLVEIANTNVNGKYIFNGTNTTEKPFDDNGKWNNPDLTQISDVKIEVANGTKLEANVDPTTVFGGTGANDVAELFEDIDFFINALDTNNQAEIDASIGKMQTRIDDVVNSRANLGARMNRLELIENRLGEQEVIAKKMMSENEDADYEKTITQLITQESILRASLSAGSRTMQPSLLDFLR